MDTPRENHSFCSSCGAPLTGGAFCGKCGAKIIASTAPVTAAEPTPAPVPAPVAVAAPAPESAPAVSLAAEPSKWKFPLVSVILMGIVFLMNLIPLFAQILALAPGAADNIAASFGLSCTEVCCLALIIVGMIICKKPRNLMVALTFLGMAMLSISGAVMAISNYLSYGFDIATALGASLYLWIDCLCFALIGLAYLVAKPKITGLKTLACIISIAFGLLGLVASIIVEQGSGAFISIVHYLLTTVALYIAVLLYTPFKKK